MQWRHLDNNLQLQNELNSVGACPARRPPTARLLADRRTSMDDGAAMGRGAGQGHNDCDATEN
jgi:hypothetical protein